MLFILRFIGIIIAVGLLIFSFLYRETSINSINHEILLPAPNEQKSLSVITEEATTTQEIERPKPAEVERPKIIKKVIKESPSPPLPQMAPLPEVLEPATTTLEAEPIPTPPPLDEEAILRAIVKIECFTADGRAKFVGSGFALKGDKVVTAAHVIKDSGSETCTVIFPHARKPIHYLRAASEKLDEVIKRHDEEGIDVAILRLPPLETYPEAQAIFESYPVIPYPVCGDPGMLGDQLLHFGYPSNFADQNYLSKLEGEAIIYADITGIKDQLSLDGTYIYKTPIFSYTDDESKFHPYMISRVPSFYGDSGGLAFNTAKQCILGPHRGGTIGRGAGENFSIFIVLGWQGIRNLISSP